MNINDIFKLLLIEISDFKEMITLTNYCTIIKKSLAFDLKLKLLNEKRLKVRLIQIDKINFLLFINHE